MKKLLILLFTILAGYCIAQDYKLDSNLINESYEKAGTCASPDAIDHVIASPPPDYNYLNNNGYCYTISPAVKNFVACYTMTAGATDVDFNAGYNTNGCTGLLINYAILYTSGTCIIVDNTAIGTTSGLTIGASYTWCISLKCTGPGPGFTTFCPYYQNITPMPVELVKFECNSEEKDIQINWLTMSETNNNHFDIVRSNNAINYTKIGTLPGQNNSSIPHEYLFKDFFPLLGDNYYQLVQVDQNGQEKRSNVIECSFTNDIPYIIVYHDILGRVVNINNCSKGVYIRELTNGINISKQIYYK